MISPCRCVNIPGGSRFVKRNRCSMSCCIISVSVASEKQEKIIFLRNFCLGVNTASPTANTAFNVFLDFWGHATRRNNMCSLMKQDSSLARISQHLSRFEKPATAVRRAPRPNQTNQNKTNMLCMCHAHLSNFFMKSTS